MSKVKTKKSGKKAKKDADRERGADLTERRRNFKAQSEGAAATRRTRSHHKAHTAAVPLRRDVEVPPALTLDARGYKRPSATLPGAGRGKVPASKGRKYPVTTRYLVSIDHFELEAAAFRREAPGVSVPDLMEAFRHER